VVQNNKPPTDSTRDPMEAFTSVAMTTMSNQGPKMEKVVRQDTQKLKQSKPRKHVKILYE